MRIPFDSLDGVQWLAFADYAADRGWKVANFATRTGRALLRMAAVGCDPRCYLLLPVADSGEEWVLGDRRWQHQLAVVTGELLEFVDIDRRWSVKAQNLRFKFDWQGMQWATRRRLLKLRQRDGFLDDCRPLSPLDFPDPWRLHRLSAKFFRSVQRRATGVAVGVGG